MNIFGIVAIGVVLMSCDDRVSHSLTPADKAASFTIETTAEESDEILSRVAGIAGQTFVKHPSPRTNSIPRDYISGIATLNCMIFAEGDTAGSSLQLTVSLQVVRDKTCEPRVTQAFKDAESLFKGRRQPISKSNNRSAG